MILLDGYCSTVQGLLDWFEVDLGFTELSFIQIDLCVPCDFVFYSDIVSDFARFHKFLCDTTQFVCLNICSYIFVLYSLSSCPSLDILHCLPSAAGVLNIFSYV